ncbi:LuxR C-terminal-related transcriptional regulator [uncultured Microbulbifer sp.]|uniref:LuxR C-terminal-related transcriptional regulator n=1 Tax=uncultured Microbulbifer sp. TaxID=348147 RepID=UPI0025D3C964|nr:LuxR C-terminal-related transcriptional regulator [uncultured Microbulbifer sp.]
MPGKVHERKPKTELLKQVWEERSELFAEEQTELSQYRLDQLVASVFCNGPYYYYVFDLADLNLLYISDLVEPIHGFSAQDATFQQILDQIHPDDMPFVAAAEETAVEMFRDVIGIDKIKKYKMSYCFRFRMADGSYRLFNHQAVVLTTDAQGRIGKALNIHTDISHLTSENNRCISMIGMEGEPSYFNLEVNMPDAGAAPTQKLFTQREISIIRLVAAGLTSAQIANELALSEYTIKNHRKRILKKAGCQNMNQLLGSNLVEELI